MATTTKNKLRISPDARPTPSHLPAAGGTLVVRFDLQTTKENAKTKATCSVSSGPPYKVSGGATQTHDVTTTKKTFSQTIKVTKSGSGSAVFFEIEVEASIPGDAAQVASCVVHIDEVLAASMKGFRDSNGLTQIALAEQLGISRSTLSKVESGGGASNAIAARLVEFLDA